MAQAAKDTYAWWQTGIIYQVYPRSFQDSNGDGIGDLPGITSRLDYLQWLGVTAVWLSPIYPSPMADFGYDISDYLAIDPVFGAMQDFDHLLAAAHEKGLKVILDFVPNHTSDQHPWFIESRRSRNSPMRDWYLWRDPAPGGGPPNNWLSNFGGSAWALDEKTGQYYYHAYLAEQPDLNWRNPEVQQAMLDNMRFWLNKGVDGFRVDVIWHLIKDELYRDNPLNPDYQPGQWPYRQLHPVYNADRPEVHDIIAGMRAVLDGYPERMMVGEIYLPVERLVTYYGAAGQGAHLPFNFQLIELPWNAAAIRAAINQYEAALPPGGWPNWVLGNHDKHRIASRIGLAQARVAAMLLLTLRGTPTLYYGDELGMQDVPIPPAMVHDLWEKNTPGLGLGRDPARTPMQWDATPNAGFTAGFPWLPVAADYQQVNAAVEQQDKASFLLLYHQLIALRQASPALTVGRYQAVEAPGDLLAYIREQDQQRFLVVLNFGGQDSEFRYAALRGTVRLSTRPGREGEPLDGSLCVAANEGVIIAL